MQIIERNILDYFPSDLELLEKIVAKCHLCDISYQRKHIVFGEGANNARLIIIAEAPGAREDELGKPFVGRSGELLTKMIENAIGIKREDVYISNIIKCRPPNNRNPLNDEAMACLPYLEKQIEIIKPEIILCLGSISFHYLNNSTLSITKARGNIFDYKGIKLIPSFHPSYLLRNPSAKKESYRDMLLIKSLLKDTIAQ
jgi:uracil-DNA glycosylase family 4